MTSQSTAAPKRRQRPASQSTDASEATEKTTKAPTKIQLVISLLERPQGARLEEIMVATGWQAHSVRGALSGSLKKGLELTVLSEKSDGVRTYRIAERGE